MPIIEVPVSPPQLPSSVRPDVMRALNTRPDIHSVSDFIAVCDCCGTAMPEEERMCHEHSSDILTSLFVCSSCEAVYQTWNAGAYCHECGVLLKDNEKAHAPDDAPLCAACEDKWMHCDDCGKHLPMTETYTTADDDSVCGDCSIAEYTTCGHCDALVKNSNIVGQYDHVPLCQSCYDDDFFTCEECGNLFPNSNAHPLNDDWLCESCYGERVTTCDDCGRVIENPDDAYSVRDRTVCERCMHENYYRCDECGEILQERYAYFDDDSCFCEYCYNARSAHIKRYSYKPPWQYQHLPAEASRNVLYMGVELEVDNASGEHGNDDMAEVMCDMLPVICKEDGSIQNGFEIVTHPMTFAYARSREDIFNKALSYLRSHGFSGHNHGGMHVHMSKSAFSDLHVVKFSRLFMDNISFWTRVSQRRQANLERWANGKTVDKSILENCFANNDDGAGYMYPCEGKVLIQKGFFTFKEFWTSWEKTHTHIGDSAPVVFHFRISTSGHLDKTNCHPHRIASDLAFVHNGILFPVDKKSKVSDTIIYRDRFLSGLVAENLKNKGIFRLIASHIGKGNKFVFLNGEGKHVICNESSGVWDAGLWYSNTTYKLRPLLYARGFPDLAAGFWDEEWDEFPPEYCLECGAPLKDGIEEDLGTCDLCGSEIYGPDWAQYKRQAAMCVRRAREHVHNVV